MSNKPKNQRLTADQVANLRQRYAAGEDDLPARFGVTRQRVHQLCRDLLPARKAAQARNKAALAARWAAIQAAVEAQMA